MSFCRPIMAPGPNTHSYISAIIHLLFSFSFLPYVKLLGFSATFFRTGMHLLVLCLTCHKLIHKGYPSFRCTFIYWIHRRKLNQAQVLVTSSLFSEFEFRYKFFFKLEQNISDWLRCVKTA